MKISCIRLGRITVPLRTPFQTALRRVAAVRDVVVILESDEGLLGFGEAPPTAAITGETEGSILSAISEHIAPALLGREVLAREENAAAVQAAIRHNASAKAACDIALWDLHGKALGAPVFRMLGGHDPRLTTDLTISVNAPEQMAMDAREAVARGYTTLKVKVGLDPAQDVARLAAVREAVGSQVRLRIDANQAWTPREAVRILAQMQARGLGLELCEQPVPARDLEGLGYVTRHSDVPILADESVFSPRDALTLLERGAASMLNIKLMKCGGLTPALRIAAAAESYGVPCMLGCMLEAKIAVNAAVHLACARRVISLIDLDGPSLCAEDPIAGGARFEGRTIVCGEAPGLGIEGIDPAAYEELAVLRL